MHFKKLIENNGWNNFLFGKNGNKLAPHDEVVAQRLLFGVADLYCDKADVLLSRESHSGRGPVDFTLGKSYKEKVIIEVKKSSNNKLLSGF